MRQSIIDGAPDTAAGLAQQAVSSGIAPIDAINLGFVLGMHDVGDQFARGQMYLPDMMASAEAMRAAMAVLDPELKKLGTERPMAGVVVLWVGLAASSPPAVDWGQPEFMLRTDDQVVATGASAFVQRTIASSTRARKAWRFFSKVARSSGATRDRPSTRF